MKELDLISQQKAFIEVQGEALSKQITALDEKLSVIDSLNSENKRLKNENKTAWGLSEKRLENKLNFFLFGVIAGLFLGGLIYIVLINL